MHRVDYKKKALKALLKMPRNQAQEIQQEFNKLAINGEHIDARQLQGRDGFRLRIGSYRVLYTRNDKELLISIVKIGPRGDIY